MLRICAMTAMVWASMLALGCQPKGGIDAPASDMVTVTGRLVSVKDDRPADGGVALTVTSEGGKPEVLFVGSAFIAGPREHVLELQRVVDAAKVGDRLQGTGRRDSTGVVMVDRLQIVH